jgi:hypothetical protein
MSNKKTMEIVNLLKEYQDIFTHDYEDLKGLVQEMGEMNIELLPKAKPIKKRPYKLAHKYKLGVQKEIKAMLIFNIIYPIDNSKWEIFMDMQPKKHDPKKLRICVDFRGLNKLIVTDPFPTPFVDEIINEFASQKCYSFTDRFFGYNKVPISKEDQEKTTIVFEFGSFAYRVISFSLKNAPAVFSKIVVKEFHKYI